MATLARLAELNRASRHDDDVPALTLLTGRPHGYVDALSQALSITLPMSFENGVGLATRDPYRFWLDPRAAEGRGALRLFAEAVEVSDHLTLQPGKVASLSVFPKQSDRDLIDLTTELQGVLERLALDLELDPSTDCVNVLVPGVTKQTGFAWLCNEMRVPPGQVAGIGDSVGDVAWLADCGVSFAPANAVDAVKTAATHVSERQDVGAVVEAYERLIETNRRV